MLSLILAPSSLVLTKSDRYVHASRSSRVSPLGTILWKLGLLVPQEAHQTLSEIDARITGSVQFTCSDCRIARLLYTICCAGIVNSVRLG